MAGIIRKKIGNTIYRVSVHYSDTSKEYLEDKLLRLARNDLTDFTKNNLLYGEKCGILSIPQTGRLLEGGSL
jgi:hypothetical protein